MTAVATCGAQERLRRAGRGPLMTSASVDAGILGLTASWLSPLHDTGLDKSASVGLTTVSDLHRPALPGSRASVFRPEAENICNGKPSTARIRNNLKLHLHRQTPAVPRQPIRLIFSVLWRPFRRKGFHQPQSGVFHTAIQGVFARVQISGKPFRTELVTPTAPFKTLSKRAPGSFVYRRPWALSGRHRRNRTIRVVRHGMAHQRAGIAAAVIRDRQAGILSHHVHVEIHQPLPGN